MDLHLLVGVLPFLENSPVILPVATVLCTSLLAGTLTSTSSPRYSLTSLDEKTSIRTAHCFDRHSHERSEITRRPGAPDGRSRPLRRGPLGRPDGQVPSIAARELGSI